MITNKTKNKVISKKERYCRNWFSWGRGLMLRKRQNLVMEFPEERRVSLHMWLVFFPIDVLVLDSGKRIVEIKRELKPFSFWRSAKKGKYVVELGLPSDYKVGERLHLGDYL